MATRTYPYEAKISITKLLLDVENPRLPTVQQDQVHAQKAMLNMQGSKAIALAEHIVINGLNPLISLCVIPFDLSKGEFMVLDGNRRLSVLKALENPMIAQGILPDASVIKLKAFSTTYHRSPIKDFKCVVFADRDEADKWIQLQHRGANQGAGLVSWDGQVGAVYDKRRGANKSPALQILDAVKDHPDLSEETKQVIAAGKFPVTSLDRLINTPYVRKKLGLDKVDGSILITHNADEVAKALVRVVDDLGTGEITVTDIKMQPQRIEYVNGLGNDRLPSNRALLPAPLPISIVAAPTAVASPASTKKTTGTPARKRGVTLIPNDCKLVIPHHRIEKIYKELKTLDIDALSNSGAVMFRVFLELSCDYFLEHKSTWTKQQIDNSTLAHKLSGCISLLASSGAVSDAELDAARKAAAGQTLLAAAVRTLHGYVHSRHYSPVGSELRTAWDDLQPFFVGLWKP